MSSDDDRCAEAERFRRIDDGFRRGDLTALRAALPDPSSLPNGPMPETIGSCLVYAIYHSPFAFIRTLLDLGAEPDAPVDDGFPPLIAALVTGRRGTPGVTPRHDTNEIVRLLLARGADPNQRGINDYTPLHMAVAERNLTAVRVLLDAGADPDLRTRIDEYESPLEMARAAGLEAFSEALARRDR
jgi:ankyrin repeat protein